MVPGWTRAVPRDPSGPKRSQAVPSGPEWSRAIPSGPEPSRAVLFGPDPTLRILVFGFPLIRFRWSPLRSRAPTLSRNALARCCQWQLVPRSNAGVAPWQRACEQSADLYGGSVRRSQKEHAEDMYTHAGFRRAGREPGPSGPEGPGWTRVVPSGPEWSRAVPSGPERSRAVPSGPARRPRENETPYRATDLRDMRRDGGVPLASRAPLVCPR